MKSTKGNLRSDREKKPATQKKIYSSQETALVVGVKFKKIDESTYELYKKNF